MFLHLGNDISVLKSSIVGVFDMDTSTGSRHTRAFLNNAEKDGRVVVVAEDLPKSAVLCRENGQDIIYICQLSTKTLEKRMSETEMV